MLDTLQLEPFTKLDRDLKKAATTLSSNEARYLVDAYYTVQGYRIRFGNQIRALSESEEPHELIRWMYGNAEGLEKNIQKALDAYSKSQTIGQWLRTVPGIGPVIASGIMAHIDIAKAPYVGHVFNYSGLNPTITWEKGQKRPWNADLKKLVVFLAGESFVKVQGNKRDIYGKVFAKRKALEQEANELGIFADQAREALEKKRYGKDTVAYAHYSQGKLPPAHIHARARRYAVKLFLSHTWEVWYEITYDKPAPAPYVVEHLGHKSHFKPPFWPLPDPTEVAHEEEIIDLSALEDTSYQEQPVPTIREQHPSLAEKIAHFKRTVAERTIIRE